MLDQVVKPATDLSVQCREKNQHRASPSALRHICSQRRCHPPAQIAAGGQSIELPDRKHEQCNGLNVQLLAGFATGLPNCARAGEITCPIRP